MSFDPRACALAEAVDDCLQSAWQMFDTQGPKHSQDSPWGQDQAQATDPPWSLKLVDSWPGLVVLGSMPAITLALDYVHGIRRLLTSGTVYSIFPLARTAMEGFAYASWVWKPALVPELRIHRALLIHRKSLEQAERRLVRICETADQESHEDAGDFRDDLERAQANSALVREDEAVIKEYITTHHGTRSLQKKPHAPDAVRQTLRTALRGGTLDSLYGELNLLVHPQPAGYVPLLPGKTHPDTRLNIPLGAFVMPVYATLLAMLQCLSNVAACCGHEPPLDYMRPAFEICSQIAPNDPDTMLITYQE